MKLAAFLPQQNYSEKTQIHTESYIIGNAVLRMFDYGLQININASGFLPKQI